MTDKLPAYKIDGHTGIGGEPEINATLFNKTTPTVRPKFHLLIPATSANVSLCRTLVSAAILNYPPPTLLHYDPNSGANTEIKNDILYIYKFLNNKDLGDEDLVMVADIHMWFQLPAQVLVDRYSRLVAMSDAGLARKYGLDEEGKLKYRTKVLFAASKWCELRAGAEDGKEPHGLCEAAPGSSLPDDLYGPLTDRVESKRTRPRYLSRSTHIGRVADLRVLYATALHSHAGNQQTTFSVLFAAQSITREQQRLASKSTVSKFWSGRARGKVDKLLRVFSGYVPEMTLNPQEVAQLGVGLDYESKIFQSMVLSTEDIRPVKFEQKTLIASPSRLAAQSFIRPLQLPADLDNSAIPPPYKVLPVPVVGGVADEPWLEIDKLPLSKQWSSIPLLTNIFSPGSSVPASINLNNFDTIGPASMDETPGFTTATATTRELEEVIWPRTWFYSHARALMRRYLRSPTGHVGAVEADNGGAGWWDLRGGFGGVWTDGGHYLEWNEVCGKYDDVMFGDGLGELGKEEKSRMGGKKINKYGNPVVVGKRVDGKKWEATEEPNMEEKTPEEVRNIVEESGNLR